MKVPAEHIHREGNEANSRIPTSHADPTCLGITLFDHRPTSVQNHHALKALEEDYLALDTTGYDSMATTYTFVLPHNVLQP